MSVTPDLIDHDDIPSDLVELGAYEWPRSEARQTLGHLFEKMRSSVVLKAHDGSMDIETRTSVALRDQIAAAAHEKLESVLCSHLDRRFLEWSRQTADLPARQAFVHPPMATDILTTWAAGHGLRVVEHLDDIGATSADMPLIVPRIERFFTRDQGQLAPLERLFDALHRFEGRVIVGCNSWAWRQIAQFDAAQLLFEKEWSVPAFNADALAALLHDTTDAMHEAKSAASGERVFQRDDDGALKDPFFQNLCGRSLGLPWVAIEMFADCAGRSTKDDVDGTGIWVTLPEPRSLSTSESPMLSFALHSLLVHGARPVAELSQLIPKPAPSGLWDRLASSGFVRIDNGIARCVLASYPSIRNELGAAGFNLDKL